MRFNGAVLEILFIIHISSRILNIPLDTAASSAEWIDFSVSAFNFQPLKELGVI